MQTIKVCAFLLFYLQTENKYLQIPYYAYTQPLAAIWSDKNFKNYETVFRSQIFFNIFKFNIMRNFILLLMISFFSCNSNDENQPSATNIDAVVRFYVLNNQGDDLLNPNNQNSIDTDNLKIYEIINGEEVEVNNPNMDAPKGFWISPPEGKFDKYRLSLTLNILEDSNTTITLLKWSESDLDSFKAELEKGEDYIICKKIWVNDIKVWDMIEDGDERFFILQK